MKKNNNYDVNDQNYGWIFILILVFLFGCAIFGGYMLYEHATSPDNNLSFSEHTDLRDISDTNTANTLYNTVSSNNIYYDMFYKEKLSNSDYLAYGFTRSNIDVPTIFGEKFTVLQSKISKTINNTFYFENEIDSINYTDSGYSNYQFRCSYDNKSSLYNCYTIDNNKNTIAVLYSNLDKVEQEDEYFYVYDNAVFVKINKDTASFTTDIEGKNNINLCDNSGVAISTSCIGFTENEQDLSEYIFKQYKDSINTYKHTFIKINGTYYYVSTEIVLKDEKVK